MECPYRHIDVERRNDVFCVRFCSQRMEEDVIGDMADELTSLITDLGCRKMALSLGPKEMDVLYSVFLAKLLMVQRRLAEKGGALKLCDASPQTIEVFEACRLKSHFHFVPDEASALAALAE